MLLVLCVLALSSRLGSIQAAAPEGGFSMDFVFSQLPQLKEFIFRTVETTVLENDIVDSFYAKLDDVIAVAEENSTADNRTSCVACKDVMTALKALAAVVPWDEARDPVVEVCYYLFENLTDEYVNTDVLCPGIIDIQGPHVYEILQPQYRKTPEDVCRNLNLCFPPKDDMPEETKRSQKPKAFSKRSEESLAERKANALRVVQMTDIHIEPQYVEGTSTDCGLDVCCLERYGAGDAWLYGDYDCNIPTRTMELFFHKTAEIDPAFVIFSGDSPPHKMWDETYASQLNCTALLIESASRILSNTTVYPNIGNHEMYPTNLFSIEYLENYTKSMTSDFAAMWTDLAGFGAEQQETMAAGGYYAITALPGLRVVSFNTNYWYSFNFYNTLIEGREEVTAMMNFMRNEFEAARENDQKLLLIGHHPPGNGDSIVLPTRDFEQLVASYADLIVLQVAGHTHYDHYRVLSDSDGDALTMTYINPPVTTKTNHNPSMRVFYLDAETYDVIDYEQYGFNLLEAAAADVIPVIDLVYSAMMEYQLPDMSPESWQQLTERMATDDELFNRYAFNYYSRYDPDFVCEGACRTTKLCSNQFYSYDDVFYCYGDGGDETTAMYDAP